VAESITPLELFRAIAEGQISEILDVRNTDEFEASQVEGSQPVPTRNVPVYRVMEELAEEADRTREDAVVVCGQGNGSQLVTEEFEALGLRTRSLAGGTDAWNRLLVPCEIEELPGTVRVWQFQRPSKACLSYVVGVPGERCIIADPTRQPQPYLDLASEHGMEVTHVVDTHVHADHISGGPVLAAELGVEYHLPPEDCGGVVPFPNRPLKDGEVLDLGSAEVKVMSMHLPGHTPGTIALLVSDLVLLVGDTIFVRLGPTRPDRLGRGARTGPLPQRPRPTAAAGAGDDRGTSALVELGGDQPRRARGHHTRGRVHRDPAQRGGNGEVRRGDRHLVAGGSRLLRHDPARQRREGGPARGRGRRPRPGPQPVRRVDVAGLTRCARCADLGAGPGASRLHEVGEAPDYRFMLANERTFLAWVRTALAMMAAGVAVVRCSSSRDSTWSGMPSVSS